MPHALEVKYGLTAQEMLDAISRRMRLRVALEGAVAEVHFERKARMAAREGWLRAYEEHDLDGMHDFTIETLNRTNIRVEVKTLRNEVKPKVEVQKTRTSNGDASSRFYGRDQFDLIAVCMGRRTGDWSEFMYCLVSELPEHKKHAGKLQVMHSVVESLEVAPRWFPQLRLAIEAYEQQLGL